MLVRAFGASAFGLRGGIPMEGARANVYHARADIDRSARVPINNPLAKKRGAPMPPSEVCGCTRRTKVRKQESVRRGTCESRRDNAPLGTRHTQGTS